MENLRDLNIEVAEEDTAAFIAALDDALHSGWERARSTPQSCEPEYYYYSCDRRGGREAAFVAIYHHFDRPNTLYSRMLSQERPQASKTSSTTQS